MHDSQSQPSTKLGRCSWMLFDFANSAFTTIIITFIFSNYFARAIAPTEAIGARWWGWAMAASGLVLAFASPVLGAIADHTGRRKPWLAFFTVLCVVGTAALWWIAPVEGGAQINMIIIALVLVVLANFGFELGIVFNNAMLPGLTTPNRLGRLSGQAWSLGYVGGLLALFACLVLFVSPDPSLFGLDKAAQEHIRITSPFIALWFAIFALPLFLFTPDQPRTAMGMGTAVRKGLNQLFNTLRNARQQPNLFRFLIAHLFYRDALNTIFLMGGLFAGAVYGLSFDQLLVFGIILNVTSALGAFVFAFLDDRIGSKKVIMVSVAGLMAVAVPLLTLSGVAVFYFLASIMGFFMGSIQSSSRTFIARLAPKGQEAEMFGLFAFSGKSTSFLGPLIVGELTVLYGHRIGLASMLIFFAIGLYLLAKVREPGV